MPITPPGMFPMAPRPRRGLLDGLFEALGQSAPRAQVPGQAGGLGGSSILSRILDPEVALPMAAALMGNQGNVANFGNALSVAGPALKRNKTAEFIRREDPELGKLIDMGLEPKDAYAIILDKKKAAKAQIPQYYGTPIFTEDAQGNVIPGQLSDTGSFKPVDLGGRKLASPTKEVDTGTEIITYDRFGKELFRQPKQNYQEKFDQAAGGAAGKAEGEQNATAASSLQAAENSLALIQSLRDDPARGRGTGMSSIFNSVPASQGYGFQRKVEQAKAGAFMTSIQQLQGFGALSNAEGQTATAAVTRMDTAASEEDFIAALDDYERIVRQGYERARIRLQGAPQGSTAAPGGGPGGNTTRNGVSWSVGP
jgi:hypothetical protein